MCDASTYCSYLDEMANADLFREGEPIECGELSEMGSWYEYIAGNNVRAMGRERIGTKRADLAPVGFLEEGAGTAS